MVGEERHGVSKIKGLNHRGSMNLFNKVLLVLHGPKIPALAWPGPDKVCNFSARGRHKVS